jgi:hypothetical protein
MKRSNTFALEALNTSTLGVRFCMFAQITLERKARLWYILEAKHLLITNPYLNKPFHMIHQGDAHQRMFLE